MPRPIDGEARCLTGALLALGAALAGGLPVVTYTSAAPAEIIDPWPRSPPAREALTGGVVRLQAAGSLMIRVPAGTSLLGSTELEVLEAAAACPPHGALAGFPDAINGCNEEWFAQELPRRPVTLDTYYLDRTEVTVADYAHCVARGRCRRVPYEEGAERFSAPTLPVTFVAYQDAVAYCTFRGARLPTEAEWEHAARGLARTTYPWGDAFHHQAANYGRVGWADTDDRDGYAELAPVGSFPAGRTPSGLLDLAGNVAEWVSDYFGPYGPGPQTNPTGAPGPLATGPTLRVVRGGDHRSDPIQLRSAARQVADASLRAPTVGFRCARSAPHRPRRATPPP